MDSLRDSASFKNLLAPRGAAEILYNTRYKFLRIGGSLVLVESMTFDQPVFNPSKAELTTGKARKGKREELPEDSEEQESDGERSRSAIVARNRARKRIFDYVLGDEELDLFCTLTLDPSKISRTEWVEIIPKLSNWLDNRVRRNGLKYVLVPEYHKDGESIHFHGCMNSDALKVAPSGIKDKGDDVYNILSWKYGFSTAKFIRGEATDRLKCAKYISKYMTKDSELVGGRYYLHGGSLAEPVYRYDNEFFDLVDGYRMDFGGKSVKIVDEIAHPSTSVENIVEKTQLC